MSEPQDLGNRPKSGPIADAGMKVDAARLGITVLALVAVTATAMAVMYREVDPALTDATADWLVVSAAGSGLDPFQDLLSLADHFGVEFAPIGGRELGDASRVHPRTPGALLLLRPLAEIPAGLAYPVYLFAISAAFLATSLGVLPATSKYPPHRVALASVLAVASLAFLATLEFGTQSSLVLFFVAITWLMLLRGRDFSAGLTLGVAATLKVFPLLILVPMWFASRRRACYAAVGTVVTINAVGLVLYNLSITNSVQALSDAAHVWMPFGANGSLAMPLARAGLPTETVGIGLALVALLVAAVLSFRGRPLDFTLPPVLTVSLLFTPLSWEHYDLLALLVVALLVPKLRLPRQNDPAMWLIAGWVAIQLLATPIHVMVLPSSRAAVVGSAALLGRLMLLGASMLVWARVTNTETESTSSAAKPSLG